MLQNKAPGQMVSPALFAFMGQNPWLEFLQRQHAIKAGCLEAEPACLVLEGISRPMTLLRLTLCSMALFFALTTSARSQEPAPAAPVIKGQGSAQIRNGDVALARWQATADALKNAIENHGATVQTGTLMSNGRVFETLSVKSDVRTRDVQVLEEKQESDQLYLTVQATIDSASPTAVCSSEYRKRALFTAIPLQHPEQLKRGEAGNLPSALAFMLASATARSGKLDTLADPGSSPLQGLADIPRPRTAVLNGLLEKHRVQAVVTGVIRNFTPVKEAGLLTLFEPDRLLEMEILVFGPLGEAPLATRRFSFRLPGATLTGPLASASSDAFANSSFGQALGRALAEVGDWVSERLACTPFTARVVSVEGNRLGLDAGSQAGLKAGDGFIVFRPGRDTGLSTPQASATIRSLQADRSIAEVSSPGGTFSLQVGDVAVSR